MNRRDFIQMTALFPLLIQSDFFSRAEAETQTDAMSRKFLQLVRVLTGQMDLPEALIMHVKEILSADDPSFLPRVTQLISRIDDPELSKRNEIIATLSENEVSVVTEIISPLYLGYIGKPENVKAIDNAKFVTFLHALMYEPTRDNLIRPSYSQRPPDYWVQVPEGVSPPPMVDNILEWGNRGPMASSAGYAKPDPRYLAICQGYARTVEEAEAYLASLGGGQ